MYNQTLEFLRALEEAVPPVNGNHSLTCSEGKLILGMREPSGNGTRILVLEPSDFEKSQSELITEIADIMSKPLI